MSVLPPVIPDHELLRLIGRGAYGEVWLARNVMGVMRAVKIVRRSSFVNHRPFEREFAAVKRYEPVSRAAAGLVNVLHAGRAADDSLFYYVMELADSAGAGVDPAVEPDHYAPCTLRLQIGRMGRMPVSECLEIAVSLTNGIADLHRVGLVHRDVKPSNIIFTGGRAKLADIGLVGDISESRSYVGTEGYVPPEGPGLPAADLYALGRVLYEIATGYEAMRFPALPPEWVQQSDQGAFEFFEVVLRCCEPDAARRYQTADQLLADLALLQSGQSVRQVRQLRGRISLLRKTAAGALILGALAFGVAWWQGREADEQRELVARAEKAEAEARQNLYEGLVQQARNARRSGEPDARFTALTLLEKASALHPGEPAMRGEFISTLATPGLQFIAESRRNSIHEAFDDALTMGLTTEGGGRLLLDQLPEGGRHSRWEASGVEWVMPVRVAAGGQAIFARDDRGRLLSWKDGSAEAPLEADGAGDCYWNVDAAGAMAVGWRTDGTVTVLERGDGGKRKAWKCLFGFRQGIESGSVLSGDASCAAFCISQGQLVMVHELPSGKLRHRLESPRALSSSLAMDAGGRVVAAGFIDGGIGVWRTDGSGACEIIEAGIVNVSGLAVSPDGRFLVSSSWAGAGYLWDLADGTRLCRTPLPAGFPVFSADGRRLVLHTGTGRRIYAFDPGDLCLSVVLPRREIVSREVNAARFSLHPQGECLVVPGRESTLLVDAGRAAVLRNLPVTAVDAIFTPDGRSLLLSGRTCTRIPFERTAAGWTAGLPQLQELNPPGVMLHQLRSTADGGTVLGWRDDTVWSIMTTGRETRHLPMARDTSEYFSVSPDGRWLAHGFRHAGVRVTAIPEGTAVHEFPGAGEWNSCVFSPDGKSLVTGDGHGFRLFRTGNWQEVWHNPSSGNGATGRDAGFDPSSRWLIHCPQPGCLTLLDPDSGREVVSLRRDRESSAAHFAMSAAGDQLWELDLRTQVLWRWNLAALRTFLRDRGLDWTDAPLPPAIPAAAAPLPGILTLIPER